MGFNDDYDNGEDIMEKYNKEPSVARGFHLEKALVYVDKNDEEIEEAIRKCFVSPDDLKDPKSENSESEL